LLYNVAVRQTALFLSALAATLSAACGTPCGDLKARAAECHTAASPYVDERRSVCAATRDALGKSTFDSFATCVNDAACNDAQAISRCQSTTIAGDVSPCTRFTLWASACGLEPPGTADDCRSMLDGMGELVFERWVTCVTASGCPVPDDDRYDRCQDELLPRATAQIIDACVLLDGWNQACVDVSPGTGAVGGGDLASCIASASPFTAESYLAYAQCLSAVPCDDFAARLSCLTRLTLSSPGTANAACERLDTYSTACGLSLGGGSVDTCVRLFARFTTESLDAYAGCLEACACDDTAAQVECGVLLRLQ
jgi:hypothetical protein